ncbi:MAG: DUF6515 family protein [Bacteroidota bacterium]|nr:DUF6515 family protein [Bacteroidota bacterium]
MKTIKLFTGIILLLLITNTSGYSQREEHRGRGHTQYSRNREPVIVRPRNQVIYKNRHDARYYNALPPERRIIRYSNHDYYFHNGHYYNYLNERYALIAPPFGLRISILPGGFRRIVIGGGIFFYSMGVYYSQVPGTTSYEVVKAPVGAIIYDLPPEAEQIMIDNMPYYEYNGVLYKSVNTAGGQGYKCVGYLKD